MSLMILTCVLFNMVAAFKPSININTQQKKKKIKKVKHTHTQHRNEIQKQKTNKTRTAQTKHFLKMFLKMVSLQRYHLVHLCWSTHSGHWIYP